ncbi:hypothetical protein PM082_022176 [Marasmius tenuissimus]|nr:hypothetical protein PM082_022176 [Marasmius tenuissimus]
MHASGPTGSAANGETQDSFHSSGTVPREALSDTFGDIGPGWFNSYGKQSEASGNGRSASGHGTGYISIALMGDQLVVCITSHPGRSRGEWELCI